MHSPVEEFSDINVVSAIYDHSKSASSAELIAQSCDLKNKDFRKNVNQSNCPLKYLFLKVGK